MRSLLVAALGITLSLALTSVARAQVAPPALDAAQPPPALDQSGDPDPATAADPDPAPAPEPAPVTPDPAPDPAPAAEEHAQPAPDKAGGRSEGSGGRDAATNAPSPAPAPATTAYTAAGPGPVAPIVPAESPVTTLPLGWDLYDDALFAETLDDDDGAGGLPGAARDGFRGLAALGKIGPAAEQDKRHDPKPVSRADPMSAGGAAPGGPGNGQGGSTGLFGAAGGSGAGMALMTLLGMACGWFLLAPDRQRAFLTPTATWRPSAYVPPIEHPG